jgi:cell division cycle protein 37
MPSGFNYSRWDKLELSDDEDTHPGAQFIEKNTLRRIKRESHEVHEEERKRKVQALEEQQAQGAWGVQHAACVCVQAACTQPPDVAAMHLRQRSPRAADKAYAELELKIAALTAEGDAAAADAARAALWKQQQEIDGRAKELERLERERKFNADDLCYVAKERSLVGRCAAAAARAGRDAAAHALARAQSGVVSRADGAPPRGTQRCLQA